MLQRIFLTVLFLLLFQNNAMAQIEIKEIDEYPQDILLEKYHSSPANPDELVNKEAVMNEVYYLQNKLPILKNMNWTIYIVNEKFTSRQNEIWGLAKNHNTIYLFAKENQEATRYVVAHEIGHLIDFNFVNDQIYKSLGRYIVNGTGFDDSAEIVAEDFYWLFGSDETRKITYRPSLNLPDEKEKEFLISQMFRNWKDKLDFYKANPDYGLKEIERVRLVYGEHISNGDIKKAKSALIWINQIREVIGLPN